MCLLLSWKDLQEPQGGSGNGRSVRGQQVLPGLSTGPSGHISQAPQRLSVCVSAALFVTGPAGCQLELRGRSGPIPVVHAPGG